MLTRVAQVPCDSRSLRNRPDSMPATCVRLEQQDLPCEEEEHIGDKKIGNVTFKRSEDSRHVTATTSAQSSEHDKITCVIPRELGKCTANHLEL